MGRMKPICQWPGFYNRRFARGAQAVAVVSSLKIIRPMSVVLPNRLKASATASIAASLSLAALPLIFPTMAIGPVALASWCLFIVASYFTLWPLPKWGTFPAETRAKWRVWMLVFAVFAIASWMAFAELG